MFWYAIRNTFLNSTKSLFFTLALFAGQLVAQNETPNDSLYQLAVSDLPAFAHQITSDDDPGFLISPYAIVS